MKGGMSQGDRGFKDSRVRGFEGVFYGNFGIIIINFAYIPLPLGRGRGEGDVVKL